MDDHEPFSPMTSPRFVKRATSSGNFDKLGSFGSMMNMATFDEDDTSTSELDDEEPDTSFQAHVKNLVLQTISDDQAEKSRQIEKEMQGAAWWIVHPRQYGKVVWDFTQAGVLAYIYIMAPWQLAFLQYDPALKERFYTGGYYSIKLLDWIADVAIMADFTLKFFVAYYTHPKKRHAPPELCTRTADTARNFVFGQHPRALRWAPSLSFLVDVMACVPLDLLWKYWLKEPNIAAWWRLLRLLRVSTIRNLVPIVKKAFMVAGDVFPTVIPFIELLMMFVDICLVCHIIACVLFLAGHPYFDDEDCDYLGTCGWVSKQASWYDKANSTFENDLSFRYVTASYYGFTILTTVGFGDISASSTKERAISIGLMVLSTVVSGVMIGNVTNVLLAQNIGTDAYRERYEQVLEYMHFHDIAKETRTRVKTFFHQMYGGSHYYDERRVLIGLPNTLHVDILEEMYMDTLDRIPFLPKTVYQMGVNLHDLSTQDAQHCLMAQAIRVAICKGLVPVMYLEGDIVVAENTLANCMYMLSQGRCDVLKNSQIVAKMSVGDFFGALSSITKGRRGATVVATSFSRLCRLDAAVMTQIQIDFPQFHDEILAWAEAQRNRITTIHGRGFKASAQDVIKTINVASAFTPGREGGASEPASFSHGNGDHPDDIAALDAMARADKDTSQAAFLKAQGAANKRNQSAFEGYVHTRAKETDADGESESEEMFELRTIRALRQMEDHMMKQSKHLMALHNAQEAQESLLDRLKYTMTHAT